MASDEGKKVGIWIRVSTEMQVKDESPEVHEFRAKSYAESRGWEVAKIYRLDAVSGKAVLSHKTTRAMMKDVENQEIDALVFSKLARLGRDTREVFTIADFFEKQGADLVSIQENIDTSSPAGKMFFTMLAAMGQFERDELSSRLKASVSARAKMGRSTGGLPPYGYHWVDKKLVAHPEEAAVRKLAYELFMEHRHKQTVARVLNERGFRTRRGGDWSYTSIMTILTDTSAKGVRTVNTRKATVRGKRQYKDRDEWVEQKVEPIISVELWEEVNRIIETARDKNPLHRRGRKPKHLFAGKLLCGRCGGKQKLYARTGMDKYCCYKCNLKIPMEDLETLFISRLREILLDPHKLDDFADQSEAKADEKGKLVENLEKELSKAKRKMETLVELYQEEAMDLASFREQYGPLEVRAAQINEEVPKLQKEQRVLLAERANQGVIKKEGIALADEWPKMDGPRRREVVETLFDSIVIREAEVEFNVAFAVSDSSKKFGQWSG